MRSSTPSPSPSRHSPMATAVLLLVLLARCLSASAETTSFVFQDGFSAGNLSLTNATVGPGGILSLTTAVAAQDTFSVALFSEPLPFWYPSTPERQQPLSFSSSFVFDLLPVPPSRFGGNGLAFLISAERGFPHLPQTGMWLFQGLFNKSTNPRSSHILAVEFAANDNQVTIDVNGTANSTAAGFFSSSGQLTNLTLVGEENSLQAWVEYSNKDSTLQVFLAPLNVTSTFKPKAPLVSAEVDLRSVMVDRMYVGFLAASGRRTPISSYVRGWSFRVGGEAEALDLSKLPKVPRAKSEKVYSFYLLVLLPLLSATIMALAMWVIFVAVKRMRKYAEVLEEWEIECGAHRISYRDVYRATRGFAESELLGKGGFGMVYKGVLPRSRTEVAVKRVSHDSRQGMKEFVAEIASIGRMRHRNLVQLLGYCRRQGELLLVYDYMPNGSLDRLLFDGPSEPLDWGRRLRIIKGVAAGLLYLHEGWEQVVIHRDVKASNVMLDGDYNGRLGDFGLARLYDHGTHPRTTHVVGTMGYLAPEFTRTGRATKATDVFAFGVFVLEVVCGRRPIEPDAAAREEVVLVDWVVKRWAEGSKLVGAADARIMEGVCGEEEAAETVMKLGLLCAHTAEEARPTMREAVQVLEGDLKVPELPTDYYWKGCAGGGRAWGLGGDGGESCVLSSVYSGAMPSESDTTRFTGR